MTMTGAIPGIVMYTACWSRFGSVHVSGFVLLHVDARDRGEIDDRTPSDLLPYARTDEDCPEVLGSGEKVNCVDPEQTEHVIHRAVAGRQDLPKHAADHDPGYEMRKVGNGLDDLLVADVVNLVQEQGEQYRCREREQDPEQADDHGVAEHPIEQRTAEQPLEVMEPRPGAPQDAIHHPVVLEGDEHAVHRLVVKEDEVDDRRDQQQVVIPVLVDLLLEGYLQGDSGTCWRAPGSRRGQRLTSL